MEVVENRPNWLPEGTTEDEVLASIERVVRLVCPSFAFGPHGIDDVMQVGRMEGFLLLKKGKFNPAKGRLEAYLIRHISRRMKNLRRSLWRSDDVGCRECYAQWERGNAEGCGADSRECKRFARWLDTQSAKVRLANAVPLEIEDSAFEIPDTARDVEHAELLRIIDERLDPSLRDTYLQMREGVAVQTDRKRLVREAVAEILREAGLEIVPELGDQVYCLQKGSEQPSSNRSEQNG